MDNAPGGARHRYKTDARPYSASEAKHSREPKPKSRGNSGVESFQDFDGDEDLAERISDVEIEPEQNYRPRSKRETSHASQPRSRKNSDLEYNNEERSEHRQKSRSENNVPWKLDVNAPKQNRSRAQSRDGGHAAPRHEGWTEDSRSYASSGHCSPSMKSPPMAKAHGEGEKVSRPAPPSGGSSPYQGNSPHRDREHRDRSSSRLGTHKEEECFKRLAPPSGYSSPIALEERRRSSMRRSVVEEEEEVVFTSQLGPSMSPVRNEKTRNPPRRGQNPMPSPLRDPDEEGFNTGRDDENNSASRDRRGRGEKSRDFNRGLSSGEYQRGSTNNDSFKNGCMHSFDEHSFGRESREASSAALLRSTTKQFEQPSGRNRAYTREKTGPTCKEIDDMMRGRITMFHPAMFPKDLMEQAKACAIPLGQPGTTCRAVIQRQEGLGGMINPYYKFCFESENSGLDTSNSLTAFLWAKKSSAIGVNVPYLISLERLDLELPRFSRSDGFVGKLSNKGHGRYVLYNSGCNPECLIESDDEENPEEEEDFYGIPSGLIKPRCEFACVIFNKDVHRPQMEIGIPSITWNGTASMLNIFQPRNKEEQLLSNFEIIAEKWNQNRLMIDRLYCLSTEEVERLIGTKDHKNRLIKESTKNFQLVLQRPSDEDREECYSSQDGTLKLVWLQMHKVGNNAWTIEFGYPLSIVQAFGICLARFDHRFK